MTNIIKLAKNIKLIPQDANDFKSKVILKNIVSLIDVIIDDNGRMPLYRLMSVYFDKSILSIKNIYHTEFDQFIRMQRKIKRDV